MINKIRKEINKILDVFEVECKQEIKWIRIGNHKVSECLGEMDWDKAVKKCKELEGELPDRVLLLDLYVNHERECYYNDLSDVTLSPKHWSSTEYDEKYAWCQDFNDGAQYNGYDKNNTFRVFCVKKIKNN